MTKDSGILLTLVEARVQLIVLMGCVIAPMVCLGQLAPCQAVTTVTGYKVLLDELRLNDTQLASQKQQIMAVLFFNLESQLTPSWSPIRCDLDHRSPAGEQSFDPSTITRLAERDVVLEIWGDINSTNDILLNYALFPIAPASNPFIRRRYNPVDLKSGAAVADWLGKLDEFKGYALLARAVRQEKKDSDSFDAAVTDLRQASFLLKTRFGQNPTPAETALIIYVDKTRCQTIANARKNPNYNGGLKAVPQDEFMRECSK